MHPHRKVAPTPLVTYVSADIQFESPIENHAGCLKAIRGSVDGSRLCFTALKRPLPSGAPERIVFVVANDSVSVAVGESGVIVDTVDYGSWDRYREVVRSIAEALAGVTSIEAQSVTLRYVDEVRLPTSEGQPVLDQYQAFVRFPMTGTSLDFSRHVVRAYGGYRFDTDDVTTSLEWTVTSESALRPDHPLYDHYEGPEAEALAMEWEAHVHGKGALEALDDAYAAVSSVFWDTLTEEGRKLMGLDS